MAVLILVKNHQKNGEYWHYACMILTIANNNMYLVGQTDRETSPKGSKAAVSPTEDPQKTINTHICFDLQDKPRQLLNALNSIIVSWHKLSLACNINLISILFLNTQDIICKINIKNIKIGPGPMPDEMVRRIYIENENPLSEEERELLIKNMTVDGGTPGNLEVSLNGEPKPVFSESDKGK